jgi:ribonuclease P protein component
VLPTGQRLQSRWLFRKTLSGLRFYACPSFVVMVLPHWNVTHAEQARTLATYKPRIGFVVSKKVNKRATARNRLKRIVREHLRQHLLPNLKAGQLSGIASMAIIFRPEASQIEEAALLKHICHAFSEKHMQRLNTLLEARVQESNTC